LPYFFQSPLPVGTKAARCYCEHQRFVLYKFAQDIEMIESEQQTYLANRRYVEINPAIIAIQRLIVRQYQQFMQKSSQLQTNGNRESENSISLFEAMPPSRPLGAPTLDKAELTKSNPIG